MAYSPDPDRRQPLPRGVATGLLILTGVGLAAWCASALLIIALSALIGA